MAGGDLAARLATVQGRIVAAARVAGRDCRAEVRAEHVHVERIDFAVGSRIARRLIDVAEHRQHKAEQTPLKLSDQVQEFVTVIHFSR